MLGDRHSPGTLPERAARYTAPSHGEGLSQLRSGPGIRQQPKPLDGRHQASLRSEPPEGADPRRQGARAACTSARAASRPARSPRPLATGRARRARRPMPVARVADPSLVRFRVALEGALAHLESRRAGDQRPQRLPGRRRRHRRQHGADPAGVPGGGRPAGCRRPAARRDRPRRDRRVGRARGAAGRARQQRRHPLPAHPRRRRGADLAPRRAHRPGAPRRRDGPRRPARLRLGPRAGRGHDADRHARHGRARRVASSPTWTTPRLGRRTPRATSRTRVLADILEGRSSPARRRCAAGPSCCPSCARPASSTPAATA